MCSNNPDLGRVFCYLKTEYKNISRRCTVGESMFKFSIKESACGQRAAVLLGRINTGADQICSRLQRGLLCGEVDVSIDGDTISFVCDGVTFNFHEDAKKLSFIERAISRGNIDLEPKEESNFLGFELFQATR